jgi:hypothetical protein
LRLLERRADELQRRLEALERGPAPAMTVAVSAPRALVAAPVASPNPAIARDLTPHQTIGRPMQPQAIDVSFRLDPELRILDGRRRRIRFVTGIVVLLVGVFASLLIALAQSYTPPHP